MCNSVCLYVLRTFLYALPAGLCLILVGSVLWALFGIWYMTWYVLGSRLGVNTKGPWFGLQRMSSSFPSSFTWRLIPHMFFKVPTVPKICHQKEGDGMSLQVECSSDRWSSCPRAVILQAR